MTPRQIAGYYFLATRRRAIERAESLRITATAGQADNKTINQAIKDLIADAGRF